MLFSDGDTDTEITSDLFDRMQSKWVCNIGSHIVLAIKSDYYYRLVLLVPSTTFCVLLCNNEILMLLGISRLLTPGGTIVPFYFPVGALAS
jgi:hypothetical protein